jgi:hypothetical protein
LPDGSPSHVGKAQLLRIEVLLSTVRRTEGLHVMPGQVLTPRGAVDRPQSRTTCIETISASVLLTIIYD